jgi:hypothetical protein
MHGGVWVSQTEPESLTLPPPIEPQMSVIHLDGNFIFCHARRQIVAIFSPTYPDLMPIFHEKVRTL